MKINPEVNTSDWRDINNNIRIPNHLSCPTPIKFICENILTMCTRIGYHRPPYHSMSELDKILMLQYWKYIDGMKEDFSKPNDFYKWFISKATSPDLIGRSRRWLIENNIMWVDANIVERAHKAGERVSKAMTPNLI